MFLSLLSFQMFSRFRSNLDYGKAISEASLFFAVVTLQSFVVLSSNTLGLFSKMEVICRGLSLIIHSSFQTCNLQIVNALMLLSSGFLN